MTLIDAKYVTAELKRRLTAAFPGVKFSVRRGTGTGCAWIRVGWTDGPATSSVWEYARVMQGSSYDAAEERYEETGREVTVTIDGQRVTGKPVVDGIHCNRTLSADALAEATALWSAAHNGDAPARDGMHAGFECEGEFIGGAWAMSQVQEIAENVLARRWEAAHKPAAPASQTPGPKAPAAPAETAAEAPAGEAVAVTHTDADGITVTGTRHGDGAAVVLRDEGMKWHRKAGCWYLPGSRGPAGADSLHAITDALHAAGLLPATADSAPEAPAAEKAPAPEVPAAAEPEVRESGAHRITETGEYLDAARSVAAYHCTRCDQRTTLVGFIPLKCTPVAEEAHAYKHADWLMEQAALRDADTLVVSEAEGAERVRSRINTTRVVADGLLAGAFARWHDGELQLKHRGQTLVTVRPAPVDEDAPEAPRGIPSGAHRIDSTGQCLDAATGAHLFRCLICAQTGRIGEFRSFTCTDEAEDAHALNSAGQCLGNRVFEGADTFLVGGPGQESGLHSRTQTLRLVADHIRTGAPVYWYETELRLTREDGVTTVRRASFTDDAGRTAPQTYRAVPIPPQTAQEWDGPGAAAWRAGVDAALTYAVLARAAE